MRPHTEKNQQRQKTSGKRKKTQSRSYSTEWRPDHYHGTYRIYGLAICVTKMDICKAIDMVRERERGGDQRGTGRGQQAPSNHNRSNFIYFLYCCTYSSIGICAIPYIEHIKCVFYFIHRLSFTYGFYYTSRHILFTFGNILEAIPVTNRFRWSSTKQVGSIRSLYALIASK